MIKRKRLLAVALVGALGLSLAACGDDDDSDSADTTGGSDAPVATTGDTGDAPRATEHRRHARDRRHGDRDRGGRRRRGSAFVTLEDECATYDGLEAPADYSVNLVTDIGKVDDGTFNQFAYEGMTAAVECFGIDESSFIETVSEADYAANIATSLRATPTRWSPSASC